MIDTAELRMMAEKALKIKGINLEGNATQVMLALAMNAEATLELLDRLDAAEKVCKATQELSDAYARDDIPEAQLYLFWATVDAVLAAWQKTKEATP